MELQSLIYVFHMNSLLMRDTRNTKWAGGKLDFLLGCTSVSLGRADALLSYCRSSLVFMPFVPLRSLRPQRCQQTS